MANTLVEDDEAFRLSDALVEKPGIWSQSDPAPSDTPILSFVMFRAFHRAMGQYRSIVNLLKSGQWEDAVILLRSLYDLNVNLSAIDSEETAKKFVHFGNFRQVRMQQRLLEDQVRDEKSKPVPMAQVIGKCEQKLADIISQLDRDFGEFRNPNGKWRESWTGASVETLAQRLAKETGGQPGQSDYYVFRIGSLFTHNDPGALLLGLGEPEAPDWNKFRAMLDDARRSGLRQFLREALICLVDIVGMAGNAIAAYEPQWFDDALRVLKKF